MNNPYNNPYGDNTAPHGDNNTPPPKPIPVNPQPTLTIAQILSANASQITAWKGDPNYLGKLHNILSTFSAANGASISAAQVTALKGSLAYLSPAALGALTSLATQAISAAQVTALKGSLAYLSPAALGALTSLATQAITPQVLMMTSANGAGAYMVDSLTQYQIQNLSTNAIASFTSSVLQSTVAVTGKPILASLYSLQLGSLSTGALGGLTLADLTQTSILKPNGRSITVLQAMPWANIARLSSEVVAGLTASQLALTNLQAQATGAPAQTVLQGLSTSQIAALSTAAIHSLSSAQLILKHAGGHTVLQDLSSTQFALLNNAQLAGLSPAAIAGIPGGNFNGFQLLALDNQGRPIWQDLSNAQIQQLPIGAIYGSMTNGVITGGPLSDPSNRYLRNMTTAQIQGIGRFVVQSMNASQLNATDLSGHLVWQDMIVNPAQASYLPSAYQWQHLTSTQVTSLFTSLVQAGSVANLNPTVFTTIPTASLVNGILGMSVANSGAFITSMTNAQLAQLSPNAVNGLLTSSTSMAATLLNAGASGSLTVGQFQALITGNTTIAQINGAVLRNALSVPALLSLTASEIAQLTGTQWQSILSNSVLSKVIYNAGSGKDYWSTEQLRAVSTAAIAQTTQDQYLRFANGLSMFTQGQQNAMSTNVALLEIMITGQTNAWTQEQIAWIVQNIPGMIPLSGLPGGGAGCFKGGGNENTGVKYQIEGDNYARMTEPVQIGMAISSAGWDRLSADNQTALLRNPNLPGVLANLTQAQLIDVMHNKNLMPQLNGANFAGLIGPISHFFSEIPRGTRATFTALTQSQVATLIGANGGPEALVRIARFTPNTLPGGALSAANVTALIGANGGPWALADIAYYAPNTLPGGALNADNVTALIGANGGLEALVHIAHCAPTSIVGALNAANVTAIIGANHGPWALQEIARYARNSFVVGALNEANVTALIGANGGPEALEQIVKNTPNILPGGALSAANVTALIGANGGPEALVDIARDAPNTLPGGALSAANVTALIGANGGLEALADIARYTPNSFAVEALTAQVTALQGTRYGIATLLNAPPLATNLGEANMAGIIASPVNFTGALALLNAGGIIAVLGSPTLRAAIDAHATNAAAIMSNASLGNAYPNLNPEGQAWLTNRIAKLPADNLITFIQNNANWLTPAALPAIGAQVYANIPVDSITVESIGRLSETAAGLALLNRLPEKLMNNVGGSSQGQQRVFFGSVNQNTLTNLLNGAPQFLNYLSHNQAISLFKDNNFDGLTPNGLGQMLNTANNSGVFLERLIDRLPDMAEKIPAAALSSLTPTQASLLPESFWQNVTTPQLNAMFNSASLGAAFFGNANTPNHISQANLDAIPAAVLVQSVAQAQGIHTTIIESWPLLTNPQQDSLRAANIPNFMPPPVNSSFAGNPLATNQQVVSGASVLAGQAYGSDSGLISAGLNQLTQAMASANTPVGAVTSSTSVFAGNPSVSNPLTLVSSVVH